MYSDSQSTITTHIPLSGRGGGGCAFSFSSNPPTDLAPENFQGKRLRKGDVNPSDGTLFWCYSDGKKYQKELWLTPEQYARKQERMRISNRRYEDTVDRKKRNAHVKIWEQSARGKALIARRRENPENRAKARELGRIRRIKYNQRPEVIAAKEERRRQQEDARRLRAALQATPEYQRLLRKRGNEYIKRRYAEDPQFALAYKVRARVYQAIQKGGASRTGRTEELVGCSFDFLRQHLERQFKGKMAWDNPGSFHIDHIVPLAALDLADPAQLRVACNWQNLRPISPKKNMSKGAKLTEPQLPLPLTITSSTNYTSC
jgi:hypothetical protein